MDIAALRALSDTPKQSAPPFSIPERNVPKAQRWFDIFSWQTFIALNWPATSDSKPSSKLNLADSTTLRVWETFADAGQIYRKDGAPPLEWTRAVTASKNKTFWMHGMSLGIPSDNPSARDGGFRTPVLDESLQAFTGPMIDQQGKWVRYQVVINRTEYDYLVSNKLYNLEGQAAFTAHSVVAFPKNEGTSRHGSMEVKTSWKQLSPVDDAARFFVRSARVVPLNGQPFTAKFALVGMHIAVRTESSPTWIWATFEHVDNTLVNDLETDPQGHPRQPTFFDASNPTIPVNQLAPKNAGPVAQFNPTTGKHDGPTLFTTWDESKTTDPTQTLMVLPIAEATAELNRQVQGALAKVGSVFQYYELIGTQWPVAPAFPGYSNGVATQSDGRLLPSSPESVLFKVPGKVVPVHLVNTTMETFFQKGNQVAGPIAVDDRLPPGVVADPNTVFATESCAGCHFSAGACVGFKKDPYGRYVVQTIDGRQYRVPIFGQNAVKGATGDADYSWLLQLRAQSAPYTGTDVVPLESLLIPNLQ